MRYNMGIEYDSSAAYERKVTRSAIDMTTKVTFSESSGTTWNTIRNHRDFPLLAT